MNPPEKPVPPEICITYAGPTYFNDGSKPIKKWRYILDQVVCYFIVSFLFLSFIAVVALSIFYPV